MQKIPLTRGGFAVVDDEDFDRLSQQKWWGRENCGLVYAITSGGISMHREIMGAKRGQFVDHINGNGLDNRRSNLRETCEPKRISLVISRAWPTRSPLRSPKSLCGNA